MKIHLPIPGPRTCLAMVGAAVDFACPPKYWHIANAQNSAADAPNEFEAEREVIKPLVDRGTTQHPPGGAAPAGAEGPTPGGVSGHPTSDLLVAAANQLELGWPFALPIRQAYLGELIPELRVRAAQIDAFGD